MDKRQEIKKYAVKARIYRFFSLVLAALGFVIFIAIYINSVEGNILSALRNPVTIITVIFPFIPAAVLSFMSARNEKKFNEQWQAYKATQSGSGSTASQSGSGTAGTPE